MMEAAAVFGNGVMRSLDLPRARLTASCVTSS